MLKYPARIDKEGNSFLVSFIDFENINTYGESMKDALKNAEDALNGCLESDFERNFDVPNPSNISNKNIHQIPVASNIAVAILLRKMRAKKSQIEIANMLGIKYQSYQKLENPHRCNPTVKTLDKIARTYGKHVNVEFVG